MSRCRRTVIMGAALLCCVAARAATFHTALVGYWQFDGAATDASSQGNDLTLQGNAAIGTPALLGSGALTLTGTQGDAATRSPADDAEYDFGAIDFTVQVWVRYNDVAAEQVLIEKFSGASGPGWTLTKLGTQQLHFFAGQSVTTVALTFNTGQWYHVVVRRAGSDLDIFRNAVNLSDAATLTGAIGDSADPLYIGRRNPADGRNFTTNGAIDEVAIWQRALSDAEIAQLYNGGAGYSIATIAVPEPASLALLAFATLARAVRR